MTVLNRQMFQPMQTQPNTPVTPLSSLVRRQSGTPPGGEVQDYIDKGYDTYEFTADKAQDKGGVLQWLKEQGSKAGKKISDFMDTGWASRDDLMRIGNEWFDPEDPNFRRFIESYWMEEGDSYIDGIEKWKVFVETSSGRGNDTEMLIEGQEHIVPRQAGTPPMGEISDRFGEKRINELMQKTSSDTGDLSKQWDRDEGVSQFTMEDFINLEAPNWHAEGVLKLVQAFGTQDEIETMIGITKRLGEEDRDEQQYEEDYKIRRALWDKYKEKIGGMDNYFKTHDRLNKEWELREETGKKLYPEMRQAGSPMQGEITPQESNLYYGDQGEQALYAELLKVLRGEIVGIEAQQVMQAAIGEFGEDYVRSLMAQGNNITSPAEGQFSGMPHQGTGMDGPYWNQAVSRQMGSPQMGEQANANNVGIMQGFEQGASNEAMVQEGMNARDAIDKTDTYDELMRSIRGDDLTEHDRRQELAAIVGEKDAYETPDSVLALVQPVIQMLDMEESQQGIGATDQAQAMNMPVQEEEVVGIQETMAANGGLIKRYRHGGPVQYFNTGDLAEKHEEYLPTYMSIADKYSNPNQGKADFYNALSQAGFNYGMGGTGMESSAFFFDKLAKEGKQRSTEDRALRMKMDLSALNAAQAALLAEAKAAKEKTKEKQNMTVGLNQTTDELIAVILGITKTEKTRVGPDTDEETVVDYDRLYQMFPKGTPLQWNWDFSQFLGKKGSTISYESSVDKNKDGGIVHRQAGTNEGGENANNVEEEIFDFGIFNPPVIAGTGERDDISKVLLGSDAALQELMEMKQYLVDDPTLGGLPGLFLEKTRGLFTMFNQLDDAYLNDKFIKEGTGLFKFFDKPAITEISKSKKRISKALADLASMKGARQSTLGQLHITEEEVDPTGGFGATVSLEKIDAVGDEFILMIKELLRGLGGPDVQYKDPDKIQKAGYDIEWLNKEFTKLDEYINTLKTLSPTEGSQSEIKNRADEAKNKKILTIKEYEDLFGTIESRLNEAQ